MADPTWLKKLGTLPEDELETISQGIKQQIFALRDLRRLIKDERIRRYQQKVLRAKMGDLTPEERDLLRAELATADTT